MSLLRQLLTTPPMSAGGIPALRRSHDIDGSAEGEQTDYQVKIRVLYGEGITNVARDEANNPLAIPDYGGTGVTHPNVMYFPDGEDGYDYWMLYTPYPPMAAEEPSIVRCDDGVSFVDTGITNPVVSATESWEDHHIADPDWIKDGATWRMYYCPSESTVDTPPGRDRKNHLAYVDSADGKTWGNKAKVLDYSDLTTALGRVDVQGFLSPVVAKVGDTYYVFFIVTLDTDDDEEGQHQALYYASGADPTSLTINSTPVYAPELGDWSFPFCQHIDIFERDGTYYIMLQGNTTFSYDYDKFGMIRCTSFPGTWAECAGNPFMTYVDGETWELRGLYKPGPVMIGDTLMLYYAAKEADNDQHIGRATLQTDSYGETVILDGRCRTDFGDVRFRQGETELDYYMEEKVDSDYAIFWVKVPTIPDAPGSVTIHVYYGKADAESESDGKDTFIEFDDFDDNSLDTDMWDEGASGGIGSISEVNERIEIAHKSDGAANEFRYIKLDAAAALPFCLRVHVDWNGEDTTENNAGVILSEQSTTVGKPFNLVDALMLMFVNGGALGRDLYLQKNPDGEAASTIHNADAAAYDAVFEIYVNSTQVKVDIDGVEWQAWVAHGMTLGALYAYLNRSGKSATTITSYFNLFWMRNVANPEPTHGAWGSEEGIVWPF